MAFEKRDMSGVLFKNDDREKDTHPNAKGQATIDGVDYWVSAWTKTDKNGNKYQSLAFKLKDAAPAKPAPVNTASTQPGGFDTMKDDIPFANPYRARLCYVV